jgi:hypothetical protein
MVEAIYSIEDRSRAALSETELSQCVGLLRRGAAVDPESAAIELPQAHARAIVVLDGSVVGIGAIKRLRPRYAAKVSSSSGFEIRRGTRELGYVAIDEGHRGHRLSSRIVSLLVSSYTDSLFATTDDERMKVVLSRNGFKRRGREWDGERARLSLWVRDPT